MSEKVAYIKTFFISVAILAESFWVTQSFRNYFASQGYFSLDLPLLSGIGGLMVLLCLTVSLSCPAWREWNQFIIVSAPVALGVYLNLVQMEPANALVISLLAFLVIAFFVERSVNIEQMLAKNLPVVFLRPAIKGLLLVFSFVVASIVFLSPVSSTINIGEKVGEVTRNQLTRFIGEKGINGPAGSILDYALREGDLETEITEQVKTALEPYRHLTTILMAVFIFVTLQGFNALVYLAYSIFVGAVFWLAEKSGFIRKETIQIEKETLKF